MGVITNYSELEALSNITDISEYTSVQDFLATGTESGFYPIQGDNIINPFGSTATGQIVEFTPSTTGGTVKGVRAPYISPAESGALTISGAGAYIALSPLEILGGCLAGLGLGALSYEANKDMWIDLSNNVFLNMPGYVPITYENIEDMSLLTLFNNSSTYVPASVMNDIYEYCKEHNVYNYVYNINNNYVDSTTQIEYEEKTLSQCIADNIKLNFSSMSFDAPIVDTHKVVAEIRKVYPTIFDCNIYQVGVEYRPYWHSALVNVIAMKTADLTYRFISKQLNPDLSEYDIGSMIGELFSISIAVHIVGEDTEYGPSVYSHALDVAFNEFIIGQRVYPATEHINRSIASSNINCTIEITPNNPSIYPNPYYIPIEIPTTVPVDFPDWWEKIIEFPVINPDIEINPYAPPVIEIPLLPVSIPTYTPWTNPVSDPTPVAQEGYVPNPSKPVVGDGTKPFFDTPNGFDPVPPYPVGGGSGGIVPIIPPIGGDANALFTVYNPTKGQLDGLGSVLWSNNILEQISRMFTNNPMDAIISLQSIFVTPITGSSKNIKLGYIDTNVASPVVTNQYVSIDCGSVTIAEYYGDYRDYSVSTKVEIFLPFIGFRELKTEDVIGGTVNVTYKVDVYTGTTLCNIKITKDGKSPVLYSFEGNCATNHPLTGADHSRQLASAVSVIGGAMIGGFGGATIAGAHAITSGGAQASIQRSGNFSGNAGAMGIKIPYIIVTRNVPSDASTHNELIGIPANKSVTLNTCRGFTRVKEVHVENVSNATNEEKSRIENLLKNGIIIR